MWYWTICIQYQMDLALTSYSYSKTQILHENKSNLGTTIYGINATTHWVRAGKGNNRNMKVTVKTLKGSKFVVECEPSQTVSAVKGIIVSSFCGITSLWRQTVEHDLSRCAMAELLILTHTYNLSQPQTPQLPCNVLSHIFVDTYLQESTNAELPAINLKLIHSGKVLKDDSTIESKNY